MSGKTPSDALESWSAAVGETLDIEPDVDISAILDLARDVAHAVERPAAPLTTFLVGYAAGQVGAGPDALDAILDRVVDLADRWSAEQA